MKCRGEVASPNSPFAKGDTGGFYVGAGFKPAQSMSFLRKQESRFPLLVGPCKTLC